MSVSLLLMIPPGVTAEDLELVPTSDVSAGFDTVYPADGVHFSKVDEGASHDSATTYCRAVTNGDKDIYGLEDMAEPAGSYDLDVTIYVVAQDVSTGTAYFDAGVVISSTEYVGINDQSAPNTWTSYNAFYEENPAGGEWTFTAINGMNIYIDCYDAAPDVDFTSFYVVVTITYNAQWAPTFTSEADTTAAEDEAYSYEATCNETVTWPADDSITTNATWGTWTQANHTFWGRPGESDVGSFYVNITATSVAGDLEGYQNYTVVVSPGPQEWAPTFTSSPDLTVTEDVPYSYEATCNESVTWGVAMTSNATWLTWTQANHTVWGTPATEDIGSYYVNITATSTAGTLEGYQNYTVTVSAPANAAPYFTSEPVMNWPNNTGYLYDVNAVDPEDDSIYYDLSGDISELGFCTIDHDTGQITGLPHIIGDFSANVSAFDGINTAWQNWTLHVYTNTPVFDSEPITEWQNGTTYQYEMHVHDPENEVLYWALEGNATGFLEIDDEIGYIRNLTGPITEMGWWYVNVSCFDGYTTTWQNFTLTALNSAPYFTFTATLTGMVNESYACPVTGHDNNSDALIYSIDASNEYTKAWLTLNLSSMQLEGVPTANGSYDVNLSVTDGLVTSWYNFTIMVDLNDENTVSILAFILALAFCVILLMAGFKERTLWLLAGPCWMICGLLVFMEYGQAFLLMSLGLGMFLMVKGAYDVAT